MKSGDLKQSSGYRPEMETPATAATGAGAEGLKNKVRGKRYRIFACRAMPMAQRRRWTVDANLMVEVLA